MKNNSDAAGTESGGGTGIGGGECSGGTNDATPAHAARGQANAALPPRAGGSKPKRPSTRGRPPSEIIAQLEHFHATCAARCAALEAENRRLAARTVALEAWTTALARLVSVTAPLRAVAAAEHATTRPGEPDTLAAAQEAAVRSFQARLKPLQPAAGGSSGVDSGGAGDAGALPVVPTWFDALCEWAADEGGLGERVRHASSSLQFLPRHLGDYVRATSLDLFHLRAAEEAGDARAAAEARARVQAAMHAALANLALALVANLPTLWQAIVLRLDTLQPWDAAWPGAATAAAVGAGVGGVSGVGGAPPPPEAAAAWMRAARLDERQLVCLRALMAQWREVAHSPWHARHAAVAASAQQWQRLDELDAEHAQLAVADATFSWLNVAFQIAAFTVIMRPDQAACAVVAAYPHALTLLAMEQGVCAMCALSGLAATATGDAAGPAAAATGAAAAPAAPAAVRAVNNNRRV